MIKNLRANKIVFILTGILALIAATIGVLRPEMYDPVIVFERVIPGVFTQDLLVLVGALILIALSLSMEGRDIRKAIVIFGVLGFFFYAYGIYAIEQVYTLLYPLYLTILAFSFYGLIYGLGSVDQAEVERLELPGWIRTAAAGYGIFIAVMFNFIWFSQLIPYLQSANRIENLFSVYIIDLVFIMPGFVLAAVLALRRRAMGIIGLPALFILGVGILSPLALAELIKPLRYDAPMVMGEFTLYAVLSIAFLTFSVVYLAALREPEALS
ncbi:MAG: hypothetical protein P1P76_09090 [Anaerolineales bacterium]|nr:hypothetical protein [Anaerolineales bacterium]